jgi:hypothetical protein
MSDAPLPSPPASADPGRACARCGYSLGGLSNIGRCPECGTPLAMTIHAWRYDVLDPPWLRSVARGTAALLAAKLVWLVAALSMVSAWSSAASHARHPPRSVAVACAVVGPKLWPAAFAASVEADAPPRVLLMLTAAVAIHGLGMLLAGARPDASRERAAMRLWLPVRVWAAVVTPLAAFGLASLAAASGARAVGAVAAPLAFRFFGLLVVTDLVGSLVLWLHLSAVARAVRRHGIALEAVTGIITLAVALGDGALLAALLFAWTGSDFWQLPAWVGVGSLAAGGLVAAYALLALSVACTSAAAAGERVGTIR